MAKKKKYKTTGKTGLFVAAALLCEKVLQDPDNVMSLIRVVDKIIVQGPIPFDTPGLPKPICQLTGFVSLKSASKRKAKVKFVVKTPSGKVLGEAADTSIDLTGNWGGGNIRVPFFLAIEEQGTHWFHVLVDEKHAAKTPLLVEYQQVKAEDIILLRDQK